MSSRCRPSLTFIAQDGTRKDPADPLPHRLPSRDPRRQGSSPSHMPSLGPRRLDDCESALGRRMSTNRSLTFMILSPSAGDRPLASRPQGAPLPRPSDRARSSQGRGRQPPPRSRRDYLRSLHCRVVLVQAPSLGSLCARRGVSLGVRSVLSPANADATPTHQTQDQEPRVERCAGAARHRSSDAHHPQWNAAPEQPDGA